MPYTTKPDDNYSALVTDALDEDTVTAMAHLVGFATVYVAGREAKVYRMVCTGLGDTNTNEAQLAHASWVSLMVDTRYNTYHLIATVMGDSKAGSLRHSGDSATELAKMLNLSKQHILDNTKGGGM